MTKNCKYMFYILTPASLKKKNWIFVGVLISGLVSSRLLLTGVILALFILPRKFQLYFLILFVLTHAAYTFKNKT